MEERNNPPGLDGKAREWLCKHGKRIALNGSDGSWTFSSCWRCVMTKGRSRPAVVRTAQSDERSTPDE